MGDLQAGRIDFLCEIIIDREAADRRRHRAGRWRSSTGSARRRCRTCRPRNEQGTEGPEAYTWNAIFLPKNTPAPIVEKLNEAAVEAINTPAVKEKLAGLGAEIATGNETTPEYLGKLVKSEIEKWAVPIKASGVSVD